jgi:type IV secretion system protein TrbJ
MNSHQIKLTKRTAISAVAIAVVSASFPARALFGVGDIVFDPINNVSNIITAVKTTAAYAQQLLDYQEMLKANLAKLQGLPDILGNELALGISMSLQGYGDQLLEKLKDNLEVAETLKSWYGASKKSPEEFIRQLAKQKEAGDQRVSTLMDHYQANGAAIQGANSSLQKLGESLATLNGPTEGLQAVAAAVGILVKQQNSMLSMMQMDTLQKAEDQAKRNGAIDADRFQEDGYKKRKAALELFLKK